MIEQEETRYLILQDAMRHLDPMKYGSIDEYWAAVEKLADSMLLWIRGMKSVTVVMQTDLPSETK